MTGPKITTKLHLHINGGGKYSTMIDYVMIDGEETGITLGTHTDGSPEYNVVERRLHFQPPGTWKEEDVQVLDLMDEGSTLEVFEEWILARAPGVREVADG